MPVSSRSRLDVFPESTSCSSCSWNESSSFALTLPHGVNESAVSGDHWRLVSGVHSWSELKNEYRCALRTATCSLFIHAVTSSARAPRRKEKESCLHAHSCQKMTRKEILGNFRTVIKRKLFWILENSWFKSIPSSYNLKMLHIDVCNVKWHIWRK